ncbi:MAG: phosphatidylglycerophosphatase A [Candidatus Omnitrophica bacterium]|nr:phosphatidylglycerophosphatase A [Candidatus Omnitrophota bacterium]
MVERLVKFIATLGGLGYSRIAPGTAGCAAAALLYLAVRQNTALQFALTFIVLLTGFAVSGRAEHIFRVKDAKPIVIDDASGLLIALAFAPFSYVNLLAIFVIFRAVDIIKPFPIRKIEGLAGSLGIMGDDILAGIYANLFYRIIFSRLI